MPLKKLNVHCFCFFFCLYSPLDFLIGLINEGNDDPCDDTFPVKKCGIEISVAILFGTLGVFFLVLIVNKWRMNNKLGK